MNKLRIKFMTDGDIRYNTTERIEFFVYDFPAKLQKGDLIELHRFIDENQLTEQQCEQVYALAWEVYYVCWSKDKDGIYLEVELQGD